MHPNESTLTRFYEAFARRDYADMQACYSLDVHFKDEVFDLRGARAHAMWHMLCENARDLAVTFSDINVNDSSGTARWEADYTFTQSGRRVHNKLQASFKFERGLIVAHQDEFNLWKWTRMALGPIGLVAGWTPGVKNKVRSMAARSLDSFVEKHPEYQK
jgi:ketosteroid isomerase-like protein